jgi:uncharacterized protein
VKPLPLAPAPAPERMRALHPLLDADGTCSLLYDLERTLIIEVPEAVRPGLAERLRSAELDGALDDWLRAEGLLTSAPRADWSEGPTPTLPQVTDVSLDMSGSCNMGCTYCFENDIGSRIGRMSEETAMAALDFAFAKSAGAPRLSLHFGSGEPLIRFDLLQRVVAEAMRRGAEAGQEVSFDLTTNATLVTPAIAEFLRDHPFSVRVSCDGPPHIHDQFRPMLSGRASYPAVERGLRRLLEALPDSVTVNSVIAGGTRLAEVWEWAKDMGIRHYHVIKVGAYAERDLNVRPADLDDFEADLRAICDDMFRDLEQGLVPIDYQPITKMVRRLMIPQPVTRFCGVAGSYLGVAADGKVYPCFRHLGLEEYELGDAREGVDDDRRRSFMGSEAADVDTRPICRDCWARYLCGGGCYADSTVYGPEKTEPQTQHCPFWRAEIEQAIRFFRRLVRADPTYCLRLFGDDPDVILESLGSGEARFAQRQNCF